LKAQPPSGSNALGRVGRVDYGQGSARNPIDKQNGADFKKLLEGKVGKKDELKFSNHAKQRMAERNIQLDPVDIQKIKDAMKKVDLKGAKESLILSDKGAFIVNVKDRKVITAMDPQAARDNAFTNIDSTVII